ncbi:MAG: cytochrome c oxidase subunit II [Elusimicrobia bacterium]|nr:cytochrome c oxidase subunit II [Elusimicrobiota bacterium]
MPFLLQASSLSVKTDRLFLASVAVCAALLMVVVFFIVYFCVRYRRSRNPEPVDVEANTALEIAWTVFPLALFLAVFYFGWTNFRYLRDVPQDAMVINVTGRQWAWSFEYPNGKQTPELYVALGRPVKLVTHTLDVIHGFFVPAMRVKVDVIPGRANYVWFTPWLLGDFDIQCTVICGVGHSRMLSKVHVIPEADFKRWYFSDEPVPKLQPVSARVPAAERGLAGLLRAKECLACHSLDGSPSVGPTFKGLYGSRQTVMGPGGRSQVTVDEDFLRRKLSDPQAVQVEGYPPVMPPARLSERELDSIVRGLKGL